MKVRTILRRSDGTDERRYGGKEVSHSKIMTEGRGAELKGLRLIQIMRKFKLDQIDHKMTTNHRGKTVCIMML